MDDMLQEIMISEIGNQCDFASKSFEKIESITTNKLNDSSDSFDGRIHTTKDEVDFIWLYISSFLTSTANISKILWGSYGDKKILQERTPLRKALNINDSMKIRDKSFRNNFEHIDNELKKWNDLANRIFIDKNIVYDSHKKSPESEIVFRQYNPTLYIIYFLGEEYNVKEIHQEIVELQQSLKSYINKRRGW